MDSAIISRILECFLLTDDSVRYTHKRLLKLIRILFTVGVLKPRLQSKCLVVLFSLPVSLQFFNNKHCPFYIDPQEKQNQYNGEALTTSCSRVHQACGFKIRLARPYRLLAFEVQRNKLDKFMHRCLVYTLFVF